MSKRGSKKKEQATSRESVRRLPQVDVVMQHPDLLGLAERMARPFIVSLVREELAELRASITSDGSSVEISADTIVSRVRERADSLLASGARRVINGTGVIINTNLGRSPLASRVAGNLEETARSYSSLEIDLASGKRGDRNTGVSKLLSLITGCGSAIVVNNNAAAVMLAVSSLAAGMEVIVSRGELVEIGGSFRLPDVIESAGGKLKEVGTTNKTRLADYEKAISDRTGLILKCHRSNFEIRGFTEEASLEQLAGLSRSSGIPVAEDLGSGAIFDFSSLGVKEEPTVMDAIATGASLVMFSGDKLLGGPQAGIITGDTATVAALRKNPMYRALRADKIITGLIESTLALYLSPDPRECVPVLALAAIPVEELVKRVDQFREQFEDPDGDRQGRLELATIQTLATFGGGTLPGQTLPSAGLEIKGRDGGMSARKISQALREAWPPVVSVIQDERVIIDFRTVLPEEESELLNSIRELR